MSRDIRITIPRSRWLRGPSNSSGLYSKDGCFCVLGHTLLQFGLPQDCLDKDVILTDLPVPEELDSLFERSSWNTKIWVSSEDAQDIITTNDDMDISDATREATLYNKFLSLGIDLEFV